MDSDFQTFYIIISSAKIKMLIVTEAILFLLKGYNIVHLMYQRSKLTFSKSRLLVTVNCKMVAITRLSPEFWLPKIFSTRHGDQNGRSFDNVLGLNWLQISIFFFFELEAKGG